MDRPQRCLLEATAASLRGERVLWQNLSPADWNELLRLAAAHKLLPLVAEAAYDCPAAKAWEGWPRVLRGVKATLLRQLTKQQELLRVYDGLCRAGTNPLVVKGSVCAALYPKPDLRQSGDEDLYAAEADFPGCCAALRELGYQPLGMADEAADFEIGWAKPGSPLRIELHRRLFAPDAAAVAELQHFFDDAFSDARLYPVEGGAAQLLSMAPQTHLLYLLLHAYKHFIHSGFGVRQVCDIGLWARRYAAELDWELLLRQLEEVRALPFAAAVFAILRQELGLALELPPCWEALQVDRIPLLEDLLEAGVYGNSSMSRRHSAPLTLEAVAAERRGKKRDGLLRRAFPRREALLRSYPELEQHPGQLPAVWAKRLLKYRRETKRQENNSLSESLRIAREREALLRKYGIL